MTMNPVPVHAALHALTEEAGLLSPLSPQAQAWLADAGDVLVLSADPGLSLVLSRQGDTSALLKTFALDVSLHGEDPLDPFLKGVLLGAQLCGASLRLGFAEPAAAMNHVDAEVLGEFGFVVNPQDADEMVGELLGHASKLVASPAETEVPASVAELLVRLAAALIEGERRFEAGRA
jgi:hypothetical protein